MLVGVGEDAEKNPSINASKPDGDSTLILRRKKKDRKNVRKDITQNLLYNIERVVVG
jgi:hypothetical protein